VGPSESTRCGGDEKLREGASLELTHLRFREGATINFLTVSGINSSFGRSGYIIAKYPLPKKLPPVQANNGLTTQPTLKPLQPAFKRSEHCPLRYPALWT